MWAIKVVWLDGKEEYLREGASVRSVIARFASREEADRQVEFMLIGMSGEVQSINVVEYPARPVTSAR